MKKTLIALVLCAVLVLMVPTQAHAASASVSANNTVSEGSTITLTFKVSGDAVKSGAVEVSCSSDFEIVSGEWLLGGEAPLKDFSGARGVFSLSTAQNLNKNIFRLVVKAKNIADAAKVTAKFTLKDTAGDVIATPSASKTIKIICKTHSYGDWTTVEPTCTNAGSKTRTCTVCGTVDKQTIPAKGHSIINSEITKTPTCTEAGMQTGTCSVCGKSVTQEVPALGHDFGAWVVLTPSTCAQAGDEVQTCKRCGVEEHREAALAPHDFGSTLEVEREATISVPGLVSGTCQNCGVFAEQETACGFADEATGTSVAAEEGTFRVGTEINVGKEQPESENTANIAQMLENTTDKFEVYNIEATAAGNKVQPNGETTVTLPVPEDYSNLVGAILVNEDGTTELLGSKLSADGKSLEVTTGKLGNIVLADLAVEKAPVEPERQGLDLKDTILLAAGFSMITLAIGIIIGRLTKKSSEKYYPM